MQITEELIHTLAPNAAALGNAKKIAARGDFINLGKSEDGTYLCGDCKGSGKNPYHTSADFIDPAAPVLRCSCPSRQIPCKHALALLMEALGGRTFAPCDIPEDILAKRGKLEQRKAAKAAGTDAKAAPKKTNAAALAKKMQKQLEGLALADRFVNDVITGGLAALSGGSIQTYRSLAKQMGDYYLPGPQALINAILLELEARQDDPAREEDSRRRIIEILVQLHATIKKARAFLQGKVEGGAVSMEDSMLYDRIGYIWQLSQLDELGLYRDNAVLAQLSFTIEFDAARAEYIDTGYWVELSTGAVYKKENLRPLKAVKHIKQDDTVLECLQIPRLYLYPGELNRRVRWESFTSRPLTPSDCAAIRAAARTDLAAAVKEVKNQIKNALSEKTAVCLIAYEQIGRTQGVCALRDRTGATIELCGRGSPSATACLDYLPDANLLENQVLAGRFFYDAKRGRILLEPLSIVSGDRIVRLSF